MKYKRAKRWISMLLTVLLIVGDGSLLQVFAAGSVSSGDAVITVSGDDGEDITVTGEEDLPEENKNVSMPEESETPDVEEMSDAEEISDSEADYNIPPREPEDFYEEPAPADYGTLVAYDEYSRTYHVDGDNYVTVIGKDATTYIDEEGALQPVDNTLVENPVSSFGRMQMNKSFVNASNDMQVVLQESVSVSGGICLPWRQGITASAWHPRKEILQVVW